MAPGVVALEGSGRRNGNSATLLREALRAAGDCLTYPLSDLSFRGCIGCGACRKTAPGCVLLDDLTPVLGALAQADGVALAAPIYYGYPSGLLKSCLDRWYSLRDGRRNLRVPQGRPALLILTQAHPDPAAYAWTVESLRKTLAGYGFVPQILVAPGLDGPDDAARSPHLLDEARLLGASFRR